MDEQEAKSLKAFIKEAKKKSPRIFEAYLTQVLGNGPAEFCHYSLHTRKFKASSG